MALLFGAIAADGSSHITPSSVYSSYPPPLQPLRSSRTRQPITQPTVFQNLRHSILSLFSSNASTVDASTPPPLPQFNTQKLQRLSVNTSQWQLPAFGFDTGSAQEQDTPVMSANFSHGEPLYEPHPVVNYPSTNADQSPRLDETQRSRANYRPLTPTTLAQLQPQSSANHVVQTPPAVYAFRRQSRLDMREMLSENWSNERVREQPEGHRRQFSGADREELILCHEVERRQREKRDKKRKNSAASGQSTKKTSRKKKNSSKTKEKMWNGRYRPCLSSSNKRLRGKSIACFLAGGLLMVLISTYLGLALSSTPLNSTGHVLMILSIAAITLVFCHFLLSVARLAFTKPVKRSPSNECLRERARRHDQGRRNLARDLEMQRDENGYAIPAQPVRITFAEAAQTSYFAPDYSSNSRGGTPDGVIPPPPPAYGIWRESVRVDPNRIYWAKNPHAQAHEAHMPLRAQHTDTLAMLEGRGGGGEAAIPALRRPPSYASDVSALSEENEQGRQARDTWGRQREEVSRVESEVARMFVHPSLRR